MLTMGARVERRTTNAQTGDIMKARFDWGDRNADQPGILILGHLDTVHPVGTVTSTLPIKRDGDRLYGPGVLDMKGGLVLAMHAFARLLEKYNSLGLPVTFMFIPDEELGSPASQEDIEAEAKNTKYVLIPEPGRENALVTGRHAFLRFRMRLIGKPAHAGKLGGGGRSAISAMAKLIQQVEGLSDHDKQISYRVGNIQGGTFVNVIPTECDAEVLCVATTKEDFHLVRKNMLGLKSPDPNVQLRLEPGPIRPLFQANEKTKDLYDFGARVAKDFGLNLGMGQFGGGSDGNFTGALGVPTLDGLGPTGDGIHTQNEYINISSLEPRAHLFAGLIEALCKRNV
tara:strand:- start:159 stop:1184 length:1026 start_codon:yes stop_codon:yes gene_type:complete